MRPGRLLCVLLSLLGAARTISGRDEATGGDGPIDPFDLEDSRTSEKDGIGDLVASEGERIGRASPPIVRRNSSPSRRLASGALVPSRISENETVAYEENEDDCETARVRSTRETTSPVAADVASDLAADIAAKPPTDEETSEEPPEELPEAQELRLVTRPARNRRPQYRPRASSAGRPPTSLDRRNVFPAEASRFSPSRPSGRPAFHSAKREPTNENCVFFARTICLEATDYPREAIARSIRANREMVAALLTDYESEDRSEKDEDVPSALALESRYENRYESNEIKRRADYSSLYENVEEGFTCPSTVVYARPQLARAVSGIWKYIINTGEHTQTLRLEKCSNPKTSCSFVSDNYRSSCTQVYNYHRLLTWESSLGLHMDIFKVPTCCSCHVHGYADLFPPVQKEPRPSRPERFPGAEFATDDPDSDGASGYPAKFDPSSLHNNFLSSSKKPVVLEAGTSNRPSFSLPGRRKKPGSSHPGSSASRPFDKLPRQHAPNTRAPGYKGPIVKSPPAKRAPGGVGGPSGRPYRRESSGDLGDRVSSGSIDVRATRDSTERSSQIYPEEEEPAEDPVDEEGRRRGTSSGDGLRIGGGGFDDEYQEPNRRVNYNYHPIIDFFKPEAASLLQASSSSPSESLSPGSTSQRTGGGGTSWKPLVSP